MENRKFIRSEINKEGLGSFMIVITLMLSFWFYYSCHFERKYYLNRKLLLYLLRNNKIKLEFKKTLSTFNDIDEYSFYYDDKTYRIWHYYERNEFVLDEPTRSDLIGLFQGDVHEYMICRKIMKYFKRNNTNTNLMIN